MNNGISGTSAEQSGNEGNRGSKRKLRLLRRAVMKWLAESEEPPAGFATSVSTRIAKYKADIAAFWNKKVRNSQSAGPARILKPVCTMLIECYTEREECWPDCSRSPHLAAELKEWRRRQAEMEEKIRNQEPELRESNVLFPEYAEWRYENSANAEYHQTVKKIQELEKALLKGSRLEKISLGEVADQLYLAVPKQVVMPEELADSWGLLWVSDDLSIEVKKSAGVRECSQANRLHLVQNIASAAKAEVLFAAGVLINKTPDNQYKARLVQPPRGHRQPKTYRLDGS